MSLHIPSTLISIIIKVVVCMGFDTSNLTVSNSDYKQHFDGLIKLSNLEETYSKLTF